MISVSSFISESTLNAWAKLSTLLLQGTYDTLYMVFVSSAISVILGVPLGVLLLVTSKGYF